MLLPMSKYKQLHSLFPWVARLLPMPYVASMQWVSFVRQVKSALIARLPVPQSSFEVSMRRADDYKRKHLVQYFCPHPIPTHIHILIPPVHTPFLIQEIPFTTIKSIHFTYLHHFQFASILTQNNKHPLFLFLLTLKLLCGKVFVTSVACLLNFAFPLVLLLQRPLLLELQLQDKVQIYLFGYAHYG